MWSEVHNDSNSLPLQGKPTRNTALILSVLKSPVGNMKGGKMIGTIFLFDR
jgi:hypothetical protein